MFDSGFEKLTLVAGAFLLLALCWCLKTQLESAHRKLDRTLASFDGLRRYLYEIDPQFDDERHLLDHLASRTALDAGANHLELVQRKKERSKRTLSTSFNDDD